LCPSLVRAQNRKSLLFLKPATLHRPSLSFLRIAKATPAPPHVAHCHKTGINCHLDVGFGGCSSSRLSNSEHDRFSTRDRAARRSVTYLEEGRGCSTRDAQRRCRGPFSSVRRIDEEFRLRAFATKILIPHTLVKSTIRHVIIQISPCVAVMPQLFKSSYTIVEGSKRIGGGAHNARASSTWFEARSNVG